MNYTKINKYSIIFFAVILFLLNGLSQVKAQELKAEISQDERMQWWRDAKFGMFIHWGLYSIPAGEWKGTEYDRIGEWIMNWAKIPPAEYRQLANQFNPQKFNPKEWVSLAKRAGMKYITLTSKHHEGFAMFKSYASDYNIIDATPYAKDIVKELAEECHKQGMPICFYYSHARDWNEPEALVHRKSDPMKLNFDSYFQRKVKPQLTEILTNYGPVGMIWFDTPLSIPKESAQELKELVRRLQPNCIISGRLGGGVQTDYSSMRDNQIPANVISGDWETPATLNDTWGFKKNDHNWKSASDLIRVLFDITAKGGNYLLNVGPDAEGVIPAPSVSILDEIGGWMDTYSEAIYGASESPFNVEFSWGNVTSKPGKLYLGIFDWPKKELCIEGLTNKVTKIHFLNDKNKMAINFKEIIKSNIDHHLLMIDLPDTAPDKAVSVLVVEIEGDVKVEDIICQNNKGTIALPGVIANVTKSGEPFELIFNNTGGGGAGNWRETDINLNWEFKVEIPGEYNIELVSAEIGYHEDPSWLDGHTVEVTMGDQKQTTIIKKERDEFNPRSQYWKKVYSSGGTLYFEKAGRYSINLNATDLKTKKIGKDFFGFTFRELNLLPIK